MVARHGTASCKQKIEDRIVRQGSIDVLLLSIAVFVRAVQRLP